MQMHDDDECVFASSSGRRLRQTINWQILYSTQAGHLTDFYTFRQSVGLAGYIYVEPIYKIITDLEENEKYSTKDDNWDDDGQSSGSRYNRPSLPYYFLAYNFSFCGDLQK